MGHGLVNHPDIFLLVLSRHYAVCYLYQDNILFKFCNLSLFNRLRATVSEENLQWPWVLLTPTALKFWYSLRSETRIYQLFSCWRVALLSLSTMRWHRYVHVMSSQSFILIMGVTFLYWNLVHMLLYMSPWNSVDALYSVCVQHRILFRTSSTDILLYNVQI